MSRIVGNTARKSKKSFTLSAESVAFLEKMRKQKRAESTSAVLEELLRAVRMHEKRTSMERELTEYYDLLSDEEIAAERQWGEFARRAFLAEDQS